MKGKGERVSDWAQCKRFARRGDRRVRRTTDEKERGQSGNNDRAVSRVRAVEREAVERNGWRRGKAGKEKEGSHEWWQPGEGNRGDRSREKRCVRKSEIEQRWLAECVRERNEGRSSSVHGMPSGDIVANDSFATRSFLWMGGSYHWSFRLNENITYVVTVYTTDSVGAATVTVVDCHAGGGKCLRGDFFFVSVKRALYTLYTSPSTL